MNHRIVQTPQGYYIGGPVVAFVLPRACMFGRDHTESLFPCIKTEKVC